ncbi:hypothetical protein MJO55_13330 [Mycolicibacterium rufum]|uniref:DUF4352 domain-containing protein n=1 Tax=Mycolicibacterium rufum TaxID=318424 RepID=A0A9X2Y3B8_9MYCO|nr:hypothetical protein [Mycolicibacterium rufum]MCV7073127.1 hypothetical protein [Mycolicibacterium rufum]ULP39296.1 hypothetical protein MJO55_13330 [Mycolicibacterium rufum]
MTGRTAGRRAALPGLVVVLLVAAAALLWHHLPTPTDLYGPFDVPATAGEPARGRAVTATVTAVRIAPEVEAAQAAGRWVVVDTTMEASGSTGLPHADLLVGPNTYLPTERFFVETLRAPLAPGIVQAGSWVFDVAAPLVEPGAAVPLVLRVWVGSEMLDSRLTIEIPADDPRISRTDTASLAPLDLSAR